MEEVVGSIPTRSTKSPDNLDGTNPCEGAQSKLRSGRDFPALLVRLF